MKIATLTVFRIALNQCLEQLLIVHAHVEIANSVVSRGLLDHEPLHTDIVIVSNPFHSAIVYNYDSRRIFNSQPPTFTSLESIGDRLAN